VCVGGALSLNPRDHRLRRWLPSTNSRQFVAIPSDGHLVVTRALPRHMGTVSTNSDPTALVSILENGEVLRTRGLDHREAREAEGDSDTSPTRTCIGSATRVPVGVPVNPSKDDVGRTRTPASARPPCSAARSDLAERVVALTTAVRMTTV
jgi:hypothetical protein